LPKKDEKRLATDPFERFLPQIGDSRKKKDADASDGASESADVSTSKDASNVTSNDADKSISTDASTVNGASKDKNTSTITSKDASEVTSASKYESADTVTSNVASKDTSTTTSVRASTVDGKSKSVSTGVGVSNGDGESAIAVTSGNTITIARRKEKGALVKMTYYLRPDQIQAIDDLQEQSGRDKSELVRMALDIMIDRAKVE
jgi:hypothetical protein